MSRRLLAFVLLPIAAGCATGANYDKALQNWHGKPEDELLRSWGPPAAVNEAGGRKYLIFDRSEQGYVPGTPTLYQPTVVGNTVFVQQIDGSPGHSYNFKCKTTFELAGGKVVSSRWEGSGCKAQ